MPMTEKQAVEFASHLDHPDVWVKLAITEQILSALESVAPPRVLAEARKKLLQAATYYQDGEAPGHAAWYHHYLRSAATASTRWSQSEKSSSGQERDQS